MEKLIKKFVSIIIDNEGRSNIPAILIAEEYGK